MTFGRVTALSAALLVATANMTYAQSKPRDEVESMYNVDDLIDQAVNNIGARYNLSKDQLDYTSRMMHTEVNRFLRDNQDEVWPMVRDLLSAKLDGNKLTEAQRKRIGVGGKPLIDKARERILSANEEWRKILSDEQKALHDWDLREMEGQFDQIRDNFRKMEKGEAVANPIFPEPNPKTKEPPRPSQPRANLHTSRTAIPPQPRIESAQNDIFDQAVANFIRDYELDSDQAESARSIGRDYKSFADAYRNNHKTDMDAVSARINEARSKGDFKAVADAEAELKQHEDRIGAFLSEMKERLLSIPREMQKAKYEQKHGAGKASKQNDQEARPSRDQDKN